jgi:pimeloyl-ACP methyl ester carboxylesterase
MTYKKSFSTFFILLSLIFLVAFNAVDKPSAIIKSKDIIQLENGAYYQTSSCWFASNKKNIQCGWLHTAPAQGQDSSDFQLPVVVFHYEGADKKEDPIVFLAGGPGAGAWLDAELLTSYWQNAWNDELSKLKRDFILFDQRGSGLSQPKIRCDIYKDHAMKLLTQPEHPQQNAIHYRQATEICWKQLKQQGMPISKLATRYSADDVADIMQALGYQTWNIQGVSYGTRLAIEVQRRYPKQVRTLTLDSAYPPSAHLFQDWPMLLNKSLLRIFQHCELNDVCASSANEFEQRFWQLLKKLNQNPIVFKMDHPDIALDHIILNDETLLAVLFHAEYRTNILTYLAEALFRLEKNDTKALQSIVEDYVLNQLDNSFSDAVYWAVECHDNPKIDRKKYFSNEPRYNKLKYYLPEDNDVCEIWNRDYQYTALNMQNSATAPVLIFSGEDDPITPTDWAIETAATFKNQAYLFSFHSVSHSVMENKECTNQLYQDFLNTPTKRPRADCRIPEQHYSSNTMIADTKANKDLIPKDVAMSVESNNVIRLPNRQINRENQ